MSCSYIPPAGDTGVGGAGAAGEVGLLAWAAGSVSQVKLARHAYTVRERALIDTGIRQQETKRRWWWWLWLW
jgi:hypothetical protein